MKTEQKHTLEPWRLGRIGTIVSDKSDGITMNGAIGKEAVKYYGGNLICESLSSSNAKRIVECVNAMEGIENPIEFMRNLWKCMDIEAFPELLEKTVREEAQSLSK